MLIQKTIFCVIALSVAFLILPVLTLNAQKDMGYGYCSAHGNYKGSSCPVCAAGNTPNPPTPVYRISRAEKKANKAAALANEATEINNKGVDFHKKGDCANALIAYQEAAIKNPDDKIIQNNIAIAKECLVQQQKVQQETQQQQQWTQQNNIAVTKMQQNIQAFTQTLNSTASTGGLDFEGKNANTTPGNTNTNSGLQFGDPNVVNTQNNPSGLPKGIDDAIAGVYKNAPPGVSDRVRKGFQAVMTKDWKAARAWFQDALKLDPDNDGLKKFIVLCDYTPGTKPDNNTISKKIPAPAIFAYVPTNEEIKAYRENRKAYEAADKELFPPNWDLPNEANAFSDNFRRYVYSLNAGDFKKFDEFCEYTAGSSPNKNTPLQKIPVLTTVDYLPTSQEIEAYQENTRRSSDPDIWLAPMTFPPGGFSEKFKTYIMSLNEKEMTKFLSIQLPKEEDIKFLFPMELPLTLAEKAKSNIFWHLEMSAINR